MVEQSMPWQLSGQVTCSTPLWSLLGSQRGLIWSIGWSCQALAPIYSFSTVFFNLHLWQTSNLLYPIGVRWWWLRVSCIARIELWPWLNHRAISIFYWKPEISSGLKILLLSRVYWSCMLILINTAGTHFGKLPTQVGL